ncbi:DUF3027 domain-containing protein [Nocardia sp. NPDC051750]|uniref:DUF3027 domain-containing protein n=1 Tax=Nocardia sp. NPDC051750 TaxID=3364325 RepID=UPI00378D732D
MSAVSVSDPDMRSILSRAVDLARGALLDLEPAGVGAHLGVRAEDECAVTHCFEATLPGYHGWQWAVVVAAAPDTDRVTVSESALLPGPDALIAPDFVPWDQRVRPGDLAPGDLLAPPADDSRLAPGYTATGDPEIDEVAYQVGLGRKQVLSLEGRADAAERWYGEYGPDSDMAKAAPASCESCGFYLPLSGALRAAFGVCANTMGADGHVVHMGYGCGAHSDTAMPTGAGSPLYEAYDDAAVEVYPAEPQKSPDAGSVPAESGDTASATTTEATAQAVDAPASAGRQGAEQRASGRSETAGSPQNLSTDTAPELAPDPVVTDTAAVGGPSAAAQPAAKGPETSTAAEEVEQGLSGVSPEPEESAGEPGHVAPHSGHSPEVSGGSAPGAEESGDPVQRTGAALFEPAAAESNEEAFGAGLQESGRIVDEPGDAPGDAAEVAEAEVRETASAEPDSGDLPSVPEDAPQESGNSDQPLSTGAEPGEVERESGPAGGAVPPVSGDAVQE